MHTRVHDTESNMGESTTSIVLECRFVQQFNQPTVICMDSYYLANVRRQLLNDRGMLLSSLIGFVSSPIFGNNKSTTLETVAGHGTRREAKLQQIISLVTRASERNLLFSTVLLRYATKCAGMRYPFTINTRRWFSGCDIFNRQLHNRTLPTPFRGTVIRP